MYSLIIRYEIECRHVPCNTACTHGSSKTEQGRLKKSPIPVSRDASSMDASSRSSLWLSGITLVSSTSFARRKKQEDEMRLLSRTPPEPQPEHRLGSRDISPFDGFSCLGTRRLKFGFLECLGAYHLDRRHHGHPGRHFRKCARHRRLERVNRRLHRGGVRRRVRRAGPGYLVPGMKGTNRPRSGAVSTCSRLLARGDHPRRRRGETEAALRRSRGDESDGRPGRSGRRAGASHGRRPGGLYHVQLEMPCRPTLITAHTVSHTDTARYLY